MEFDGTAGNDQYFGTPEADRIHGHGGQDQLRGADGNDTVDGGAGPDSLYGDRGDDTIEGGAGNDVVRGGRGDDVLYGDADVDVLFGDRDDDLLFGGDGDDILLGGPGDDGIHGGPGADYINGGLGIDAVSYADSPLGVSVTLDDSVLVPGKGGHAEGDILIGIEGVGGSEAADELDATNNGRFDALFGAGGNDTLSGGGAGHSDHLEGGPDDDHLRAHSHGGTMVGGPGEDIFEYYGGRFTGGEIQDFTKGEDKIAFDFGTFGRIGDDDLDRLLHLSEGNVLRLALLGTGFEDFGDLTLNVPVSTLSASDFIIE